MTKILTDVIYLTEKLTLIQTLLLNIGTCVIAKENGELDEYDLVSQLDVVCFDLLMLDEEVQTLIDYIKGV